jgi:hypothetical protein
MGRCIDYHPSTTENRMSEHRRQLLDVLADELRLLTSFSMRFERSVQSVFERAIEEAGKTIVSLTVPLRDPEKRDRQAGLLDAAVNRTKVSYK